MSEEASEISPLFKIESRLRSLTPAKLYADSWISPTSKNLNRIFTHLRTLHRILQGYLPRQVVQDQPTPGINDYKWDEGTLIFTDLSGFTPLLETMSTLGQEGAATLLETLNSYFTEMLQVVSKSGGNLLEFTGDALLIQFPSQSKHDTEMAVRAGLRMQRAMKRFENFTILDKEFKLGMRVGIHYANFLIADIGTPRRMEHILLGDDVLAAKLAEGNGIIGRVCLTPQAMERVKDTFRFEDGKEGYHLIIDDLSDEDLGSYEISPPTSRMPSMVLFDASAEGLVDTICDTLELVEPLASFIPGSILHMLIENTGPRGLKPDFPLATVVFVNILGLPENIGELNEEDQKELVTSFSRVISQVNAEVEAQGGVMKKVTYHHAGPDIMIFFGVPEAHTNDTMRAVETAYEVSRLIRLFPALNIRDQKYKLTGHIGITRGQVFAAEIGDKQGRREYNIMGNTVNTAARLMDHADESKIIMTEAVYEEIKDSFQTTEHKDISLKGRSVKLTIYELGKKIRDRKVKSSGGDK